MSYLNLIPNGNLHRLILLMFFIGLLFSTIIIGFTYAETKVCNKYQCKAPNINDPALKLEMVYQGNDTQLKYKYNQSGEVHLLTPVTKMAFLGKNDFLLLNKNDGRVIRIVNHTISKPLIDLNVANKWERGLLGIATSTNMNKTHIFLYFTESKSGDGSDICLTVFCAKPKEPIQNKLYRYDLVNNKLINPKLLFTGPESNIASHIGGALEVGPDNNVYLIIGDFHGYQINVTTHAQNYKNGSFPDGRAGILRFTQDGKPVGDGILGKKYPLNLYYAYGIRNGYGLDFDPVSGKLWDTENGPSYGDEINLVNPGFNSGWNKIHGTSRVVQPKDFVDFGGKGKYKAPVFVWNQTVAPTALRFLDSTKLGENYENDLFVASFNLGVIYHFDLNKDRTALKLPNSNSILAENQDSHSTPFVEGIGKITDMQVGPDGNLYVLSRYFNKGTIFRISK
jgi:aldose sugar dehydrogenase